MPVQSRPCIRHPLDLDHNAPVMSIARIEGASIEFICRPTIVRPD